MHSVMLSGSCIAMSMFAFASPFRHGGRLSGPSFLHHMRSTPSNLQHKCNGSLRRRLVRDVHLPPLSGQIDDLAGDTNRSSVTGTVYVAVGGEGEGELPGYYPTVQLYTKNGCTLCDKATDILRSVQDTNPHSLEAIDITDNDKQDYFDKYKYDIPVLHLQSKYWTKHRLTPDEAIAALSAAKAGTFEEQIGEPDAGAMERKAADRMKE